ncbi:hypothetical protein F8M41_002862 [Gigaspora margarita]|uniref:Uncharacterized protein n=1 Tax=Gigaspora margarita TaxID=4874 RepID=A0A8H3XC58_GIGMA|nr:hypothetical protein F8M41_002862 [Gigaspora margarita]
MVLDSARTGDNRRPQDNREISTDNKAVLPKGDRTETLQEYLESELTDELAITIGIFIFASDTNPKKEIQCKNILSS